MFTHRVAHQGVLYLKTMYLMYYCWRRKQPCVITFHFIFFPSPVMCLTGTCSYICSWLHACLCTQIRVVTVFSPPQMTEMGSAVRLALLGLLLFLQIGRAPARSPRKADQVSEADIQRLLHGVMEQLGIARPRVEYPAHQATNIVGPQSIQGTLGAVFGV